jgi:hypothetical protein
VPRAKPVLSVAVVVAVVALAATALLWRTGSGDREESRAARRSFAPIPRIDVHVHVPPELAERAVEMFRTLGGVRIALNASGGHPDGGGLEESEDAMRRTGGALRPYCSLDLSQVESETFPAYARDTLASCREHGAVGLKISKALGPGSPSPTARS